MSSQREDITISRHAYARLVNPAAMLCDECINGCATLLLACDVPLAHKTCIFTSHILTISSNDEALWRNSHKTYFWMKDNWIIPIHQRNKLHWALAMIDFPSHTIHIYDSLAEHASFESYVEVCAAISVCRTC